jgi:hypothetical protein
MWGKKISLHHLAQMLHNRSVTVRRLSAARRSKTTVGASPLCAVLLRHIFLFARNCYRSFLYRKQKNVKLPLRVMCKFCNKSSINIDRNLYIFDKKIEFIPLKLTDFK